MVPASSRRAPDAQRHAVAPGSGHTGGRSPRLRRGIRAPRDSQHRSLDRWQSSGGLAEILCGTLGTRGHGLRIGSNLTTDGRRSGCATRYRVAARNEPTRRVVHRRGADRGDWSLRSRSEESVSTRLEVSSANTLARSGHRLVGRDRRSCRGAAALTVRANRRYRMVGGRVIGRRIRISGPRTGPVPKNESPLAVGATHSVSGCPNLSSRFGTSACLRTN